MQKYMQQTFRIHTRTADAKAGSATRRLPHALASGRRRLAKSLVWVGSLALLFALAPAAPTHAVTLPAAMANTGPGGPPPPWSASGENAGDYFGSPVVAIGDVNGDGYSDLAIAAGSFGSRTGKVYVFHGGPLALSGTAATPAWSATGENVGDSFDNPVSIGDVNGDGYDDLAVAASNYSSGTGKVYVFHGSATGLAGTAATPAWSATGENASDRFGWPMVGVGDVNGDGFADLAVGAVDYSSGTGKVYVFHGSATGLSGTAATPAWSAAGEHADDHFGRHIVKAGDVNGDGFADLAVDASWYDSSSIGRAYVFHGSAAGLAGTAATPAWSYTTGSTNNMFSNSVATAGDVNGDGFADLAVEADWYTISGYTGNMYVFHGSAGGLSATPNWNVGNPIGYLQGIGDVNGDGCDDLGVTGMATSSSMGNVYVFQGSANGLNATPDWNYSAGQSAITIQSSMARVGDVNGDGYDDLTVGFVLYYGRGINSSSISVFLGSATGLNAVPAWGPSGAGSSFYGVGDINGDGCTDLAVADPNNGAGKVAIFHDSAATVPRLFLPAAHKP